MVSLTRTPTLNPKPCPCPYPRPYPYPCRNPYTLGIVIVGGDGTLNEVIEGLTMRPDAAKARAQLVILMIA